MYEYKATRFVCIYIFVDLYSDAGSSHIRVSTKSERVFRECFACHIKSF